MRAFPRKPGEAVSDRVVTILREAILDGVLAPDVWLREMEVATALGVSRTPVRDAFRTLASEGLLGLSAHKGARVAQMTTDDILELYSVREALEGLAARLAAKRGSERQLEELAESLAKTQSATMRGDYGLLTVLSVELHRIIRDAAANRYLSRSLSQIEAATGRFRASTYERPGDAERSLDEHAALVSAIRARDHEGAERIAVEHMRRLAKVRFEMLVEGY